MTANWLIDYVAAQRWYGAADQKVVGARFLQREPVTDTVDWALLNLMFQPGPNAVYQLFVDESARADAADRVEVVRWMFPDLGATSVRLLEGEQSNTSLVVDGDVIVKVFRRVTREPNPDVEVVDRLWAVGFRSVPEPLGNFSRDGRDLAVARRFLRGATDAWRLAVADAGFLAHVPELGRVTAEMHVALARAFDVGPGDGRSWADAMQRQLGRVELPSGLDPAPVYRDLARAGGDVGAAIRIHGDYHLGQVLRHEERWYVLDFEGEPARPVSERTAPSSPLRDVAGMLRSFGYAAAVGEHGPEWERDARERFVEAYFATPGIDELLPADREAVLATFELDKAVYEVAYERANRPDWQDVPLRAVRRLLGQG